MTQEEKNILLKDLSSRLPYGVICKLSAKDANVSITEKLEISGLEHFIFGTMDVRPYLRSMSSMTNEEKEEVRRRFCYEWEESVMELYCSIEIIDFDCFIDWLNEHHFDYRGLIEKGLALEAKEGMYKIE